MAASSSLSLLTPSSLLPRARCHHGSRPFLSPTPQFKRLHRPRIGSSQLTIRASSSAIDEASALDPQHSSQEPDPELVASLKLKLLVSFYQSSLLFAVKWVIWLYPQGVCINARVKNFSDLNFSFFLLLHETLEI